LSNVKSSKPVKLFKFIRNCINIAIIFVCYTFAMCLSCQVFFYFMVIFMTIIDRRRNFPAVCDVYTLDSIAHMLSNVSRRTFLTYYMANV